MISKPLPLHIRIAALQCNFEGGPKKTLLVPGLWRRFGFNVEQLLHTHAEVYSAVFDRRRHGALLSRYIAEARRNGLAIILYLNCHILLESQKDRVAHWAMIGKDGKALRLYNTYYGCCVNSSWTDFFLRSIESLKGFDLAGIFFDGPINAPCFCPRCRARFRARHGRTMAGASAPDVNEFALNSSLDFMTRAYDRVKEVNPDRLAYFNLPLLHSRMTDSQMRRALTCNDIVETEGGFQFYGPPKDVDIWRCGMNARAVEAVAGERPRLIAIAGDHKPWSWYLHTPAETRLCYASALANGAGVWYGIHCRTAHLDSPTGRAARQMVRFDRRHDDLYRRTASLSDVALLYSFNTAKRYTSSGEATDFYRGGGAEKDAVIGNYWDSLNGAYGLLFRSGIPCDIITELNIEDLRRYRVLVAPTSACLEKNVVEAIRDFARRGGVLIADSETSLYDEDGNRQKDFLLADVFGASFRGYRQYASHDYFGFAPRRDLFARENTPWIPAPLMAVDIAAARGAEVIARLCPPLPGCYAGAPGKPVHPFIIRNRAGKGLSYYVAGTFFELYRKFGIPHHRHIVRQIVRRHAKPLVELMEAAPGEPAAPQSVEFTVRRTSRANTVLVHLVNYTGGMTRPIEKVVPLRGAILKANVPVDSATALVAGRKLPVRRNGLIRLPEIREFEVVAITTA
ncbi:MAG: beta-galactosidase trimerization domain-containing protein [Verrucomicrobiota bacterium]|nr:beta-galactosidase trimerization domain-containing protein [Verrucomicrobiota bacterium]